MERASYEGRSFDFNFPEDLVMISSNESEESLDVGSSGEGDQTKSVGSSDLVTNETNQTKEVVMMGNSNVEVNGYSTDEDLHFPREEHQEYNLEGGKVVKMGYKRNKEKVVCGVFYRCK